MNDATSHCILRASFRHTISYEVLQMSLREIEIDAIKSSLKIYS